jgi:uncharacterized SAM-binding protein YcdF (DUF218 family)
MLRRALAGGAVLVAVAVLAAPWVLPAAGRFLIVADPPEPADAIVVLAGSYPDRILEAVELYRAGFAPRIIICRDPDSAAFRRVSELGVRIPRPHEVNRMVAEQLGVPPAAITVLDRAGESTYAEAEAVLAEVERRGYRSILLVTSKYHTRRAAEIYRLLAAGRVRIIVRPAQTDEFSADAWWRDRVSTRRLIIEYQKWLNFQLVDRWRLAPVGAPAATPAAGGTTQ